MSRISVQAFVTFLVPFALEKKNSFEKKHFSSLCDAMDVGWESQRCPKCNAGASHGIQMFMSGPLFLFIFHTISKAKWRKVEVREKIIRTLSQEVIMVQSNV